MGNLLFYDPKTLRRVKSIPFTCTAPKDVAFDGQYYHVLCGDVLQIQVSKNSASTVSRMSFSKLPYPMYRAGLATDGHNFYLAMAASASSGSDTYIYLYNPYSEQLKTIYQYALVGRTISMDFHAGQLFYTNTSWYTMGPQAIRTFNPFSQKPGKSVTIKPEFTTPSVTGLTFDGNKYWVVKDEDPPFWSARLLSCDRDGNISKSKDLPLFDPVPTGLCFDGQYVVGVSA